MRSSLSSLRHTNSIGNLGLFSTNNDNMFGTESPSQQVTEEQRDFLSDLREHLLLCGTAVAETEDNRMSHLRFALDEAESSAQILTPYPNSGYRNRIGKVKKSGNMLISNFEKNEIEDRHPEADLHLPSSKKSFQHICSILGLPMFDSEFALKSEPNCPLEDLTDVDINSSIEEMLTVLTAEVERNLQDQRRQKSEGGNRNELKHKRIQFLLRKEFSERLVDFLWEINEKGDGGVRQAVQRVARDLWCGFTMATQTKDVKFSMMRSFLASV